MSPPLNKKLEPVPSIQPAPTPAPAPAPAAAPVPAPARRRSGKPLRFLFIGLVLVAAIVFGGREAWLRFTHIYEYDARITGDLTTMSSRIEGLVTQMVVSEGAIVKKGDVLVQLDDRISRLRLTAIEAQIAGIAAERKRLQAERNLIDQQTRSKLVTRSSGVRMSQAGRAAVEAEITLARQELTRARSLLDRRVGTERAVQVAESNLARLESNRRRMEAEQAQAQGSVEEVTAERNQLTVIESQLAALEFTEANLRAQLEQQKIDLSDRAVRAPTDGVVDRTFIESGEYVSAGQRMLLMHDPKDIWIEANIKETAVRKLQLGQRVEVDVDAYPDGRFIGKVARIGTSTTARFALLPTPNPSGNFTKITQRIPVKIEIVEASQPLAAGMMVEVNIDVR
jgi:membrane fusion protein (multidrug efflux system)